MANNSLPAGWSRLPLKDVVDQFIVPMRDKPSSWSGEIPWCRIEDFDGKFLFGSKSNQSVDLQTVDSMNLKIFPVGTVLCSCSATLGICTITARALVSNQTFIGLVSGAKLDKEFLYYTMVSQADILQGMSSGTTIAYLPRRKFEAFEINIPPLSEQIRIAEFLSIIDNQIDYTESLRLKYKQVKTGLVQNLFTRGVNPNGKIRPSKEESPELYWKSPIGWIPKSWVVAPLSSLTQHEITYGIVQAGPHFENGIPYIRTGDMSGDSLSRESLLCTSPLIAASYSRSQIKHGEIVCAIRATVGKVLVVPQELEGANLTQGTARISPNKETNTDFLVWSFRSDRTQRLIGKAIKGTTFNEITLKDLRNLQFAIPSNFSEQKQISEILNAADSKILEENRTLNKLEMQKHGLVHDLLTGRVRMIA